MPTRDLDSRCTTSVRKYLTADVGRLPYRVFFPSPCSGLFRSFASRFDRRFSFWFSDLFLIGLRRPPPPSTPVRLSSDPGATSRPLLRPGGHARRGGLSGPAAIRASVRPSPCSDRDTCIAPTRRPRAMRRPIIVVARAPARPSIHVTRHRRVCTAARRSTLPASSSAASGRLRQARRLPQLGRRCSVGRSGLAARAPALLWQPGCRC